MGGWGDRGGGGDKGADQGGWMGMEWHGVEGWGLWQCWGLGPEAEWAALI